jgi:hypothetical protein
LTSASIGGLRMLPRALLLLLLLLLLWPFLWSFLWPLPLPLLWPTTVIDGSGRGEGVSS